MIIKFLTLPWLAAVHLAQPEQPQLVPEPKPPDPLCQQLFDTYVRGVKVNDSDRYAAYHLIASRGRNNGFIDYVWEEFRKESDDSFLALRYVQILGKVLETDAGARVALEAQKRGQYGGAWIPSIALGDAVVPELVERAQRVNRDRLTVYLIAIARARDPRAKPYFEELLRAREKPSSEQSDQFHAAVGLANLGEPSGAEWLIEHVDDEEGHVLGAWPEFVPDIRISSCCRAVLRDLSELPISTTREQWRAWFNLKRNYDVRNPIRLKERI